MSDTRATLEAFLAQWGEALSARALMRFKIGELPADGLTPASKADAFTGQFGFQPIGFNWEMLDPGLDLNAPRSARATLVEALTNDMTKHTVQWLGEARALECADALLGAFDPARRTVLSNHLNGLWYPISGAADEWSFVVMDETTIALLVLAGKG